MALKTEERCLKISGRVQGVGFRFWAVRLVHKIGDISGYICNLPSGEVLVLLNGPEEKLNRLQTYLYSGPLFARVDKIEFAPELKIYFPPVENGVFKRI